MATTVIGDRGHRVRALAAVASAALAFGALALVGAPVADAASKTAPVKVKEATMEWAVSQYVMGANPAAPSLSEVQAAEPPTTFVAGTGWQFVDGTGTYDTKTGATLLSFPGALEFGNTNAGNYGFKFANPTVTLDATGAGTLSADVSLRPVGGGPYAAPTKIVVVDVTGATPTTTPIKAKKGSPSTAKHVEINVTPAAFSAAMVAAAGDLGPFFQATGSSNDGIKPPAPLTVAFDYKVKSKS